MSSDWSLDVRTHSAADSGADPVRHWVGDGCSGGHYDDPEAVIKRIDCLEAALQDSVARNEETYAALVAACAAVGVEYEDLSSLRLLSASVRGVRKSRIANDAERATRRRESYRRYNEKRSRA